MIISGDYANITVPTGGELMKRTTKIDAIMPVSKLRVAAYCRVSTAIDEQKASLDTQKTHYETYIFGD